MRHFLVVIFLAFFFSAFTQPFSAEIRAFAKQDSISPPQSGQVLFVGSSSFRLWHDLQACFPETPIINRGFGGASLEDLIYYEKQVITPYKPRKIVIYCGENDFATADTVQARHVYERFTRLYDMIRRDFPRTPIIYVSMKPSPSRQHLMTKIDSGNKLIQQYLRKKQHATFVDVYHPMLDAKGQPRPELFVDDQLHMNREGYLIWQKALAPFLAR